MGVDLAQNLEFLNEGLDLDLGRDRDLVQDYAVNEGRISRMLGIPGRPAIAGRFFWLSGSEKYKRKTFQDIPNGQLKKMYGKYWTMLDIYWTMIVRIC